MEQIIRRFRTGAEYHIENAAESIRRLRYVGKAKIEGKELYIFRPLRKARKQKRAGRSGIPEFSFDE